MQLQDKNSLERISLFYKQLQIFYHFLKSLRSPIKNKTKPRITSMLIGIEWSFISLCLVFPLQLGAATRNIELTPNSIGSVLSHTLIDTEMRPIDTNHLFFGNLIYVLIGFLFTILIFSSAKFELFRFNNSIFLSWVLFFSFTVMSIIVLFITIIYIT